MNATLWITLPTNEENELKEVIHLISSENLQSQTLNQIQRFFQKKLNSEQGRIDEGSEDADKWQRILRNYSAIVEQGRPIIHLNTATDKVLSRINSVKSQFRQHGKIELADKVFEPNELLCLIIMCYTNPTLIGPNLCQALKNNNQTNIKKEMIENSAYSSAENRVLPSASNLRLLSTALYFNDTLIKLPTNVINRVTTETIQKGLIVRKLDQRGGFEEVINGPERARNNSMARSKRAFSPEAVLQSLQSNDVGFAGNGHTLSQLDSPASVSHMSQLGNGSELTPEVLALNATDNAASSSYGNGLVIGSLAIFHIAKNTPITAVVRNIGKDLATASKHLGSFFSRNNSEYLEEIDQKTALITPAPTTKS